MMSFKTWLGGLTVRELGQRVWKRLLADDIFGYAAQLSYYFLFALFPLLLILITVLGFFADAGTDLRLSLFQYLARLMPPSAAGLIIQTIDEINQAASGSKISLGILATLWAASSGMGALIAGLNGAYGIKETRPWWKVRLISIGLTIVLSIVIVAGLTLIFYGGRIGSGLADAHGLGAAFTVGWNLVQWPIGLILIVLFFSAIYYFAPSPHGQTWHFISPGALVGLVLWLLVSFGFRLYLHYFNSYSKTYGSLGAVIILLLWFYLTGTAILLGGEVNSEIYHAKTGEPKKKVSRVRRHSKHAKK